MNAPPLVRRRRPVQLTGDAFWTLKQAGAFAAYSKAELLEGEISGVPVQDDDEPESDASVPIKLRVQDYAHLNNKGLLDVYGKTELIDGLVYAMSPQYRPHGFIKDELAYRLRRALEVTHPSLHPATEQSLALDHVSEPQPDIILTSEPRGDGPIPAWSVALLVEVSASTLSFDLGEKAYLYAQAGIPEYWVADVQGRVLHQMWTPTPDGYADRRRHAFGASLAAATIDRLLVDTSHL